LKWNSRKLLLRKSCFRWGFLQTFLLSKHFQKLYSIFRWISYRILQSVKGFFYLFLFNYFLINFYLSVITMISLVVKSSSSKVSLILKSNSYNSALNFLSLIKENSLKAIRSLVFLESGKFVSFIASLMILDPKSSNFKV